MELGEQQGLICLLQLGLGRNENKEYWVFMSIIISDWAIGYAKYL